MARERKPKFGIKLKNIIEEWGKQFPHVVTWLGKIQAKQLDCWSLYLFCRWTKINPEELYHLKDDRNSTEAENLLDRFVAAKTDYTQSVKWRAVQSVKSFFKHNYRDLARASGKMDREKVKPYRKPTKEGLYKLWKAAMNPRDRAIITFLNSTAIAKETAVNLRWSHFEDGWEKAEIPSISIESELIKGHGLGRYKGVRQETFLTPEAKKDMMDYREWMTRMKGVQWTRDMYVFLQVHGPFDKLGYKNFGMVVRRISENAGVPFSSHDARRYVQTALEETGISHNWCRKIRGRKVRGEEAPYSRPEIEKLREAYRKALPYLSFMPTATDIHVREAYFKSEIAHLVARAKTLPLEEQRTYLREYLGALPEDQRRGLIKSLSEIELSTHWDPTKEPTPIIYVLQDVAREIQQGRSTKKKTNPGNPYESKLITENELTEYLNAGWEFVATINSRIAVRRRKT